MAPAKQRLEAGNDAGLKGDKRLIIDFEFARPERLSARTVGVTAWPGTAKSGYGTKVTAAMAVK
jgi:hypothetical protein